MPKQALYWEVEDFKQKPGRPRTNWRGVVKNDLQWMGLAWEEVEVSVKDRHEWHQYQCVALCISDVGWIKVAVKVSLWARAELGYVKNHILS